MQTLIPTRLKKELAQLDELYSELCDLQRNFSKEKGNDMLVENNVAVQDDPALWCSVRNFVEEKFELLGADFKMVFRKAFDKYAEELEDFEQQLDTIAGLEAEAEEVTEEIQEAEAMIATYRKLIDAKAESVQKLYTKRRGLKVVVKRRTASLTENKTSSSETYSVALTQAHERILSNQQQAEAIEAQIRALQEQHAALFSSTPPPPAPQQGVATTLYFLKFPNYCKFGIAKDLNRRLNALSKAHGVMPVVHETFVFPSRELAKKVESKLTTGYGGDAYYEGLVEEGVDGYTECFRTEELADVVQAARKHYGLLVK